ncbi:hypothetical protein [Psychroserpens algicola]|uniref:hypothetical protein n=1 Tax=Psychroserpens algicola TaxID=1719034 RepID=UPI001952A890|nr:hypothetical protein [Psychroserpens algicola]
MKTIKLLTVLTIAFLSLTIISCSDDDSSGGSSCSNLVDQPVQGSFRGTDFVSPAGFYKVLNFGETTTIRCDIYVKESLDSDCFFPTFEGDQDTILFSISSFDLQTITLEEFGENTLNFNRITIEENGPVTEVELAECGTIEITAYDADAGTLEGTVVAKGQFGSTVNGNFTLLLCED